MWSLETSLHENFLIYCHIICNKTWVPVLILLFHLSIGRVYNVLPIGEMMFPLPSREHKSWRAQQVKAELWGRPGNSACQSPSGEQPLLYAQRYDLSHSKGLPYFLFPVSVSWQPVSTESRLFTNLHMGKNKLGDSKRHAENKMADLSKKTYIYIFKVFREYFMGGNGFSGVETI